MKHWMLAACAVIALLPALGAYAGQVPTQQAPQSQSASDPVPISRVPPHYPPMAQYEGFEGSVDVCFTVEADGTLADFRIEKSKLWTRQPGTPRHKIRKALDSAAKESLKAEAVYTMTQWKFRPAEKNGKPAATPDTCQEIRFHLGR